MTASLAEPASGQKQPLTRVPRSHVHLGLPGSLLESLGAQFRYPDLKFQSGILIVNPMTGTIVGGFQEFTG